MNKTLAPRGSSGWLAPLAALGVCALLGACTHTSILERVDEVVRPTTEFDFQDGFEPAGESSAICRDLGDPGLASLQQRLASDSLDLQAAVSRIQVAEARAREAGALIWPRIDTQVQVTRAGNATPSAADTTTTYQPSATVSYEVDVWGKLRNNKKAVLLDADATREDFRSLAVTLSSLVAETWFGITGERALVALLEDQTSTSERFLELTELRFGQGLGAAQDIGRQREQLLGLEGQIELARGRLEALEARLSSLLGTTARATPATSPELEDLLAETGDPRLGVPAQLLESRPDLIAARQRLAAADMRLAVAVKDWLPRLSLSGTLFDLRQTIGDLFEDLLWQVAGALSETTFEGGGRRARIDQAKALAEESLYDYAQALIGAVSEVHTAVSAHRSQNAFLENLRQRLIEASRVLELTRESYRQGATDYLNVLIALLSQQSLEQQQITARLQQLSNRVQLCRALGHPTGSALSDFVFQPRLSEASPASRSPASSPHFRSSSP